MKFLYSHVKQITLQNARNNECKSVLTEALNIFFVKCEVKKNTLLYT